MKAVSVIVVCMVLAAFSISCSSVFADQGLIPVTPNVSIYEPGQTAIVAWNGREEILILSTDVRSTEQTTVVQLLPLPSEPLVEAASFSSFETIQSMIWSEGTSVYVDKTLNDVKAASVQVVFHEEIGAHNITVAKATDAVELADWVDDVLKANNIAQSVSLGDFEPVIEDYMDRGYRYYVLDLVDVLPDLRSVDPILYRFDSNFLYYPLAITSPVPGDTSITLFLLTQGRVQSDYLPLENAFYLFPGSQKSIEFALSKGELSKVDLRIGELFSEMAWLTVLKYQGPPSLATTDLAITAEDVVPVTSSGQTVNVNVDLSFPATMIALFLILGGVLTLAAVVCTALVFRIGRAKDKTN